MGLKNLKTVINESLQMLSPRERFARMREALSLVSSGKPVTAPDGECSAAQDDAASWQNDDTNAQPFVNKPQLDHTKPNGSTPGDPSFEDSTVVLGWFPRPLVNIRAVLPKSAGDRLDAWVGPTRSQYDKWAMDTFANESFRDSLEEFTERVERVNKFLSPAVSTLQMRDWGSGKLERLTRVGTLTSAAFSVTKVAVNAVEKYSENVEQRLRKPKKWVKASAIPSMIPRNSVPIISNLCSLVAVVANRHWHQFDRQLDWGNIAEGAHNSIENVFVWDMPGFDGKLYVVFPKYAYSASGDSDESEEESYHQRYKLQVRGVDRDPTALELLTTAKMAYLPNDRPEKLTVAYSNAQREKFTVAVQNLHWTFLEENNYAAKALSFERGLNAVTASERTLQTMAGLQETQLTELLMNRWESVKALAEAGHGNGAVRSILLYAPPGLGKTMGAIQAAWKIGRSFSLLSRNLHEIVYNHMPISTVHDYRSADDIEMDVTDLLALTGPRVIVLDELDAIFDSSERAWMEEFSNLRASLPGPCLIIVTANRPHRMDRALLRPGRMDELIEVTPEMVGEARSPALAMLNLSDAQMETVKRWPLAYIEELRQRALMYKPTSTQLSAYIHELDQRQQEADYEYGQACEWGKRFQLPTDSSADDEDEDDDGD